MHWTFCRCSYYSVVAFGSFVQIAKVQYVQYSTKYQVRSITLLFLPLSEGIWNRPWRRICTDATVNLIVDANARDCTWFPVLRHNSLRYCNSTVRCSNLTNSVRNKPVPQTDTGAMLNNHFACMFIWCIYPSILRILPIYFTYWRVARKPSSLSLIMSIQSVCGKASIVNSVRCLVFAYTTPQK